LRVGLQLPWYDWPGSRTADLGEALRSAAVRAERAGFASLWVMDHVFGIEVDAPPFPRAGQREDAMLECYAVLNHLAAVTTTISLGPLVVSAFHRHPAVLVKAATTLDVLSGGRSYLGLGGGWYRGEARGLGIPYPDQDERYRLLEETIRIAKHLWSGDRTPFVGERFTLEQPINEPQPIQWPHPPLLIGGSGEQRTLRLVARYADACNLNFGAGPSEYAESLDEIRHKLTVLRRHADGLGRDLGEIEVTALGSSHLGIGGVGSQEVVDTLAAVGEAGVSHVIVNMADAYAPGVLERYGEEVIPALDAVGVAAG
jgi:alkanesulfonate monooxygenase SsuD/methylene tetrahydromethanopterin reductase-like flavin-dependent oxidoreductase (luciferase family)